MRTVRLSEAIPRRTMNAQLLALLDAVTSLGPHSSGEQQAIQEDFRTPDEAKKAATALRNYVKNNKQDICVAFPANSKTITLYKGKRKKRSPASGTTASASKGV